MNKVYLIGIGPGDPDYLTVQAINTMRKIDVFFLLEKEGEGCKDFLKMRKKVLERYLESGKYRIVVARIPKRKKGGNPYVEEIKVWRQETAAVIAGLIKNEMKEGENGALLVWGDPSLYDGHLEMLQHILKGGAINFEYEAIPGITSIQVLAAKHKIPLNRIGESIVITTGRKLKEYSTDEVTNVIVLLDSYSAFKRFQDTNIDIYWGSYLGTEDEILISGKLKDVIDDIKKLKSEAKKKKGWLMDTYILRRSNKKSV
ncbi:MAG: precorrin-6A synthase (deacetylating) [Thermodesulfovibrionales bacterium]|nr:precorrin-6A synthase (deacetylating) [Nitrospinota bacterium]MCG2709063.1 precorrin-6A synthase (deacetylating) [Thermodesulfovibrionales bacterium]MDP3049282.1 precorrin-6A synthase (deacetylating) [Thermodesulfovibrionales bacterium]